MAEWLKMDIYQKVLSAIKQYYKQHKKGITFIELRTKWDFGVPDESLNKKVHTLKKHFDIESRVEKRKMKIKTIDGNEYTFNKNCLCYYPKGVLKNG